MVRQTILKEYATWHAVAALRSVSPVKDRERLRACVDMITLEDLAGISSQEDFDTWHRHIVEKIVASEPELSYGWAAKLLNVYLKTLVYVSADFYPEKRPLLHPPIDGMLQDTLVGLGKQDRKVQIKDMSAERYAEVLALYRRLALAEDLLPIEMDKYWQY